MFSTDMARSAATRPHRLSNLHRYVLIVAQPYTCLCKLLRRSVGTHVYGHFEK